MRAVDCFGGSVWLTPWFCAAVRALLARPGVLVKGTVLPQDLDGINTERLLEVLAAGGPLDSELVQELCVGPQAANTELGDDEGRLSSVAAAVQTGKLPGHELDLVAYEVAALHFVEEDATEVSEQRHQLLQALRQAAGLSRREVSHIQALVRSARELEREFEEGEIPDRSSLEYRLFLCRCAACFNPVRAPRLLADHRPTSARAS